MDQNEKETLRETLKTAKRLPWPQNLVYAVLEKEVVDFSQDQMAGLNYAIDCTQEWSKQYGRRGADYSKDKEIVYLFFKDGLSFNQVAKTIKFSPAVVERHLLETVKGMRGRRKYLQNGLSVCLAEDKEAAEAYWTAHPLERDLFDLLDVLGAPASRRVFRSMKRARINTLGDLAAQIDINARKPYAKIQTAVRGLGEKGMREMVETLRKVIDLPAFDPEAREKERELMELAVDREKVLGDYVTAKALEMFDEETIFEALKKKYPVSTEYLTSLCGKNQTMQQFHSLAELANEADRSGANQGSTEPQQVYDSIGFDC